MPFSFRARGEGNRARVEATGKETLLPTPRDRAPRTIQGVALNVALTKKAAPKSLFLDIVGPMPVDFPGNNNCKS